MYDNEEKIEKAVLAGVNTGEYDADASMAELEELVDTAGAEVVATVIQNKDKPNSATFLGNGKMAEITELCEKYDAQLLIFDGELTPSQQRNIEDITSVAVIDRTALILDIFAQRAKSSEGKLQVELAQLSYRLPRLGGQGKSLSRLGGGIGTRGPGESKLESDKRHIHRRINAIKAELKEVEKRRNILRLRRKKNAVQTVAIVGYTNAGKSTLMNSLTDAGVLAEDMLFATLDPTARALNLKDGRKIMLVDTVGLVRRLPHQLVDSFKSTLEEAANADLILNVCDASSEDCAEHLKVTVSLLNELGCENKPIISVMNKCDLVPEIYGVSSFGNTVLISAKEQKGLDKLLEKIEKTLPSARHRVWISVPFNDVALMNKIRQYGIIHSEEYTASGIKIDATIDDSLLDKSGDYIIEK